jgi:hypothetical protein
MANTRALIAMAKGEPRVTMGNKRITIYEDGYGNTTGIIGRDRINLYTDTSGTTTGTIGRRRLNCFTDRFRTTTCN